MTGSGTRSVKSSGRFDEIGTTCLEQHVGAHCCARDASWGVRCVGGVVRGMWGALQATPPSARHYLHIVSVTRPPEILEIAAWSRSEKRRQQSNCAVQEQLGNP